MNTAPLSQTQLGIYLECLRAGEGTYNRHALYTIDDSIDMDKLASAFEAAVKAHPYLNVRIVEDDGEPRQYIPDNAGEYRQTVQRISGEQWRRRVQEIIAEPLQLIGGQLFRFDLAETEDAKYFLYTLHHIMSDGTTINILFRDIASAYDGKDLTPEEYSAADFAIDEERLRAGGTYAKAKQWYEEKFSGLDVESMPLPDRHEDGNIHGDYTEIFPLDNAQLRTFCRNNNITSSALTSGAFGFLAGTYTHQNEALFSTIYHGRDDKRTKDIAGMFVKTLPVYCRWDKETTTEAFLAEITEQIKASRENDIYSYAELNKICPLGNNPLFAYHGTIRTYIEFCGKPCTEELLDTKSTGFAFSVEVMNVPEGIKFYCEYDACRYSEDFIRTFAGSYENVLRQLMTKEYLREITTATDGQITILDGFNNTKAPYDASQSVVSLFSEAVKKYPDRTAVIFRDREYTYSEVDELSGKIACYVAGRGLGRGDVVSVLIPRGEYMACASLGALKAGCAYQPLDASYPPERLNFMIQDSGAKLLITTEELRPLITDYSGDVLLLGEIPSLENSHANFASPQPEDLFILLYTSGSTGTPKGVKLTHKNLVCFINWYHKYYSLEPDSCVGQYASYGFDACMMDMYPALTRGAAVCIIPEEIRLDLEAINRYLEANNVTHLFMTTQVGRRFATDIKNNSLEYLSTGGEKLASLNPPEGYNFYNVYGPTECTIFTTVYQVTHNEENIPIGKPLDNLSLYVVDTSGNRVPIGALGELWVSGAQVGDGYLNQPEKTAEVFGANPFGEGRIYRTGDIVRYRPDGNIEFFGRRDGQVKIGGFRIELSEVEAVIREFTGIDDVAVAAFDNESGKFIAAYVVSDGTVDIDALNQFIRSRKPPYMVPAVTMQIDRMPLNQNHKVDRRALPKPEFRAEEKDIQRPLNVLEEELQGIIGGIMGTKSIPVTEPLIHLGLDSILSIQLSVQLYHRFGVEMQSRVLLEGASLGDIENIILREFLSGKNTAETAKHEVHEAPLSYPQMGVYYDCMKRPAEILYNIPSLFVMPENTDTQKLTSALSAIVKAHPALSVNFELENGNVIQVLKEHDINIINAEISEDGLEQYKRDFVRPFDLAKDTLYRFAVVRTEKNLYLMADFHHLVFDGASLNLFIDELGRALEGGEIKPEEYTYFDYTEDEKKFEDSPEFEENKKYFASMLKDFENSSEIASDLNGNEENGIMGIENCEFDFEAAAKFCRERNVTPAALFLAASFYTVSRFINDHSVYLSTISSGRSDVRTANTFGMFVNTLPLGITIGEGTAEDFVMQCAKLLSQTVAHEKYPFAKIAADYGYEPKIMYEYQIGVVGGDKIRREELGLETAKFRLAIHIEQHGSKYYVAVYYNNALYSRALIQNIARSAVIAAEKIITEPQKPIRNVELIDSERRNTLAQFHSEAKSDIPLKLLHEVLHKYALIQPDKTALIACDGSFTWRELDELTNGTARSLMERGITSRGKIAILLPRTSRVILAMFGIMKAGCAYIPCDPEYPAERVSHILNDSGASCVITTQDRLHDFPNAIDIETLIRRDKDAPITDVTPKDLAYLIYTSGSTGKPKGVMLRHESICNYLTGHPANIHIHALAEDAKTLLSVTTVSFDMSLKEIGAALFNGLTLVLADDDQTKNPMLLAELFRNTGADAFNATPSRMAQYMELPAFCEALSGCKVIMCGAEKYPSGLLEKLRKITHARIFNTYGPTEITVSSNAKELTNTGNISVVPIGRPLLNVTEYIVDSDGNELPPGIVGELYIGGVGVASGYNGLPEMTAEKFITYRNMRVYRSGDYAYWNYEGDVVVLGRTDNQVKLRGLRIELGEVEAAIARAEGIKSVAVKISTVKGQEHLCAYFTADRKIDIAGLREELSRTLAKYMIPTAYLQLDKMPMTPNGKTDLRSLPEAVIERNTSEHAANDIERIFCGIFGHVLGLDDVGATEDFFALGGTSLSVTQVMIEAQNAGYRIGFADVFSHATPRLLAGLFSGQDEQEVTDDITGYDYSRLQGVLEANNIQSFRNGECRPLGDILLTGAAGYLGIHILHELLENSDAKIYCLMRGKGNYTVERRLKGQLFYYFERTYEELLNKRLFIIEGDVTSPVPELEVSTVINCAAVVKHFSAGTEIEDTNIGGVKNLINYCLSHNARLIQISTMSTVSMDMQEGHKLPEGRLIGESDLYFGQSLENKYVHSKFIAERSILEAIADKGLKAKIMRVGNLSARYSDGEFQINYGTNSSMGRLKVYAMLGMCPYEQLDVPMEFSPIDEVAKAVLLLSTTPDKCVIFHPYNHNTMLSANVFQEMTRCGLEVRPVETADFQEALRLAGKDPAKSRLLTSMLAYSGGGVHVARHNSYTMQVLYRMGWSWPVTTWDYVGRFLNALKGLGFFGA